MPKSYSSSGSYDSESEYNDDESEFAYRLDTERHKQVGKWHILKEISEGGFACTFVAGERLRNRKQQRQQRQQRRKRKHNRNSISEPKNTDKTSKTSNNKEDQEEGTKVCLKIYHTAEDPTDKEEHREIYESAQKEFRIADKLRHHTNIINILECSQFTSPSPSKSLFSFIVMDYYKFDLYAYHEGFSAVGGMYIDVACEVIMQVAAGLKAMHEAGFAHLDIKMENILYNGQTETGKTQYVICDLGSAHKIGGPLEPSGHTLQFSAPELVVEEASCIGPYTDVFALGCLYYTLLTGADLFDVGEYAYLDMLGLQKRYSTSPHHPKIKKHKEYFHMNGMLHNNAELKWAGVPLWYQVYSEYLPPYTIHIIQKATEADFRERITLDEILREIREKNLTLIHTKSSE